MTQNESMLLIGGPKHGETITMPKEINFKSVDFGEGLPKEEVIYTICKSGDGYYYGVFNPNSSDPSIARIEALRAMFGYDR